MIIITDTIERLFYARKYSKQLSKCSIALVHACFLLLYHSVLQLCTLIRKKP